MPRVGWKLEPFHVDVDVLFRVYFLTSLLVTACYHLQPICGGMLAPLELQVWLRFSKNEAAQHLLLDVLLDPCLPHPFLFRWRGRSGDVLGLALDSGCCALVAEATLPPDACLAAPLATQVALPSVWARGPAFATARAPAGRAGHCARYEADMECKPSLSRCYEKP